MLVALCMAANISYQFREETNKTLQVEHDLVTVDRRVSTQLKALRYRSYEGSFNFTAQLGGSVQLFTSSRRTAIDPGYKYHHFSNAVSAFRGNA
jgi:uncharacterized protein YjbK